MKTVADGLKRCYGQFEGFETSPCAFPCHTYHTQTKYVSQQGQHGHKKGRYRVTFHFLQKVSEDLKISYWWKTTTLKKHFMPCCILTGKR